MTREQAINIAHNLTQAVENGWLTEIQARNRFKIVVHAYRRAEQGRKLQEDYEKLPFIDGEPPFNYLQDLSGRK